MSVAALPTLESQLAQVATPEMLPASRTCHSTTCAVFVVSKVINASGGRTGCFLYRGSLVTPQPRSHTPLPGGVPPVLCAAEEEGQVDFSEYEGQELTLYLSYEEASPKIKQRSGGMAATQMAPWRAILRDQQDELLYCLRGLPSRLQLDSKLQLAAWGPSVALAFSTADDARTFASGLCRVEVDTCSLADSPQGALLAAHTMQQALGNVVPKLTLSAHPGKYPVPEGASTCPPSPARNSDAPRAASACGKRKSHFPAALLTPTVKPRILAIITPTCSSDLVPQ